MIAATLEVDILGFLYILDGVEYADDIWSTITPSEFYDKLREGSKASTSAISIGQYLEFFTKCAEEGTPTVYLCFTSALSSSYNSACHAAEQVRADHPEFELYVVDNALPCACGELLAMEAVRQRAAGLSARQLAEWANEAKTYIHGYFTLDSLDALSAGGRIPPAAASLSSKLDIKPELSFDRPNSFIHRREPRSQEGTQVAHQVIHRELRVRPDLAARHRLLRRREGCRLARGCRS